MTFEPKKIFVLEDGKYIELTYQEFCGHRKSDIAYSDKHFIPLHGMLMEVSEEVYKEFYQSRRRQKYLDERSVENGDFSYDMLTAGGFNGEDILIDESPDIADIVVDKLMLDKLRQAISLLTEREKTVIRQYFFEELSQTELSRIYGVHQSNISRQIMKILQKLRKFL